MQAGSVYSQRARSLDRFVDLARHILRTRPEQSSVILTCAQYWNDEASDAVQYGIAAAPDVVPIDRPCDLDLDSVHQRLAWDSNVEAVWAFAAMCTEEGYDEATGVVDAAMKDVYRAIHSPLAIAQRDGDDMRVTWLGLLHRPWLDADDAFADRTYTLVSGPEARPPRTLSLVGNEPALYDEVLAGDDGAREVLRDAWTLRGDPRGELCGLAGLRPVPARAADLVAEYGRSWLGPLHPVIPLSGALFGPGPFVRKAIVHATKEAFDAVADAPEWGTVEAIEFAPGSYRGFTPRMHRLRAVGPIGAAELPGLIACGAQIEELEYETEGDALEALAATALPLKILRLRGSENHRTTLERAPWWDSLERLELWFPLLSPAEAHLAVGMVEHVKTWIPDTIMFAIGILDCGMRSGWMVCCGRGGDRLELQKPDARDELASQLAQHSKLPRVPRLLDGDDWLALALGVCSTVSLE